MVGYEEAQPYHKYKKQKKTIGNIVGGFLSILVGVDLLNKQKQLNNLASNYGIK